MSESEMPILSEEPSSRIPEFVMSIPAAICRSKSQANTSRRVTPTPTSEVIEKQLPNGDLYIGTFSGTTPHGSAISNLEGWKGKALSSAPMAISIKAPG
ncbi:hypothetical protein LIER_44089 [Lithospermum erythrorhizon]|uniref:Uncharacterized protein n=1 Tax=Lithospermum erythrorhizon TaxID=34254 RepID=A0AAV3PB32_LITER